MKVNLGSTIDRNINGLICVDLVNDNIIHDLNTKWPFEDNSVEYLRAYDIFEHLKDKQFTMQEAYRVLQPRGTLDIFVPSTDGRGAFCDPTHVSYWNQLSIIYYCDNWPEWLKLNHQYGFTGCFHADELYTTKMDENMICHVKATLRKV